MSSEEETVTMSRADEPRSAKRVLERGDEVGRYLILRVLGAGGTGIVYLADDPRLHRKVALKLVRHDRRAGLKSPGRDRMLREAQALAKLRHPNIVRIFDVGEFGDEVFIAMEYVAGDTLAKLIKAGPLDLKAALQLFVQIAAGLEAAHAAGLVHRDLKPANVLVDGEGGVKVLDFGQALPDRADGVPEGTPGYMAPEQYRGEAVGREADVFAFNASLYEALVGSRAFPGDVHAAYALAANGTLNISAAPIVVQDFIRTGLSFEPDERGAGMLAARGELEAILARPRRRRRTVAIVGAVLVGSVLGASATGLVGQRLCPAVPASSYLQSEDLDLVRRGFTGIGAPGGRYVRVEGRLRGYAKALGEAERGRCMAAEEGVMSGRALDEVAVCLDFAQQDFQAVVETLAQGSRAALNSSDRLLDELLPPGSCHSAASRMRQPSLPPGARARERVLAQHARLSEAAAMRSSGRLDAATAVLDALDADLGDEGDQGVRARLTYQRGLLAADERRPADAEQDLSMAVELAAGTDDDFLMVQSMVALARVQSEGLHQPAKAQATLDLSARFARALGSPPELDHPIRFAQGRGVRELEDHDRGCAQMAALLDEPELGNNKIGFLLELTDCSTTLTGGAQRLIEERQIVAQARGEDDPVVAELELGIAKVVSGDPRRQRWAVGLVSHAGDVSVRTYGLRSMAVAQVLQRMGLMALRRHELPQAARYLLHARTLVAGQDPVDRYELGRISSNYGVVLSRLGAYDAAVGAFELTERLYAEELGARDPKLVIPLINLVETHGRRGDFEAAIDVAERGKRLRTSRPEARAALDVAQARALLAVGEPRLALRLNRSVVEDRSVRPWDVRGAALLGLLESHTALGNNARALELAWKLNATGLALPIEGRARFHLVLARLAAADGDAPRAAWHARTARRYYAEGTAEWPSDREAVEDFLHLQAP